jgi:hypothetical protein
MLTINELKLIDPSLQDLSDEEITDIRARLYALAELALDCWADHVRENSTSVASDTSRDTLVP